MKYIVCVKQVPGTNEVRLDPETHAIMRDARAAVINPLDYSALEVAVNLKKKTGGTVTALSMGIPATEGLLRDACSRGADNGLLLTDRAFAGADTLATSYTLSLGINALGGADVVLCGKNAIDGDTAQIGPELAYTLGLNLVTDVTGVISADEKTITVKKATDSGVQTVYVTLPALLTVVGTEIQPSLPTLSGVRRSLMADIRIMNAADAAADVSRTGFAGSPTSVVKTFVSENTRAGTPVAAPDAADFLLKSISDAR